MTSTLTGTSPSTTDQAVVASYSSHRDAEDAVRSLAAAGIPVNAISIVGRQFETHEDIQGFYQPVDAVLSGAGQGAWFGGIFGLMMGAFGFFVVPAVGALLVLGPLSGLVAGAIGGAGVGAIISGLIALGIPHDQALKYQERLQAGEFLLVVHGDPSLVQKAHDILSSTPKLHLDTHRSG